MRSSSGSAPGRVRRVRDDEKNGSDSPMSNSGREAKDRLEGEGDWVGGLRLRSSGSRWSSDGRSEGGDGGEMGESGGSMSMSMVDDG